MQPKSHFPDNYIKELILSSTQGFLKTRLMVYRTFALIIKCFGTSIRTIPSKCEDFKEVVSGYHYMITSMVMAGCPFQDSEVSSTHEFTNWWISATHMWSSQNCSTSLLACKRRFSWCVRLSFICLLVNMVKTVSINEQTYQSLLLWVLNKYMLLCGDLVQFFQQGKKLLWNSWSK